MGSVSLIQTNAGLPFTFSPSKLIKEDPFFINPRYISYLEANSVKTIISLQLELSYVSSKELSVFLNIIFTLIGKQKVSAFVVLLCRECR